MSDSLRPRGLSPPGSSPRASPRRNAGGVAASSSRGSSRPGRTQASCCNAGGFFTSRAAGENSFLPSPPPRQSRCGLRTPRYPSPSVLVRLTRLSDLRVELSPRTAPRASLGCYLPALLHPSHFPGPSLRSSSPRTSGLLGPSLLAFPLTTCQNWKFPRTGWIFFFFSFSPLWPPLVHSDFEVPEMWMQTGLSVSCSRPFTHLKSPPCVDKHPQAVTVMGSFEKVCSTHLKWNVAPSPFQVDSYNFLWMVSHPLLD